MHKWELMNKYLHIANIYKCLCLSVYVCCMRIHILFAHFGDRV